jgi:hypothetical protein
MIVLWRAMGSPKSTDTRVALAVPRKLEQRRTCTIPHPTPVVLTALNWPISPRSESGDYSRQVLNSWRHPKAIRNHGLVCR